MKNNTYTLVIENGYKIVKEFNSKQAIVEAIKAVFGTQKANTVKNWAAAAFTDDTYRDEKFYIHYLCNI